MQLADDARAIFQAVVTVCSPARRIAQTVAREGNTLIVKGDRHQLTGKLAFICLGKSASLCAQGLMETLGEPDVALAVGPDDSSRVPFETVVGTHPLPDEGSVKGAERALEIARSLGEDDLLVVAVSGGASSLAELASPPLTLKDIRLLYSSLLSSGESIGAVNGLRSALSLLKGGGLARAAYPARTIGLLFSDVPGDDIRNIGSGPTVPGPVGDCARLLKSLDLPGEVTERAEEALVVQREAPSFASNYLLASSYDAASAASEKAGELGYMPVMERAGYGVECERLAQEMVSRLEEGLEGKRAHIWQGEVNLRVERPGLGGRCQHLCLLVVSSRPPSGKWVVLAADTDGRDGNSDAAGGFITGFGSYPDPAPYLQDFNSSRYVTLFARPFQTGPTGCNAGDLYLLLAGE